MSAITEEDVMDTVLVDRDGDGIVTVTLNRPHKLNAFTKPMWGRMGDVFRELGADESVRCVVIRGAGERAFGPGNDISEFKTDRSNARQAKQYGVLMHGTIQALKSMPHPTIAMIHGFCVGGAFMQLLSTDFAITADSATFSLSEVNWGILPGALVAKLVADACLPRRALYYSCTGEAFDGHEAERIGIVDKVVPEEDLIMEVDKLAKELLKKSLLIWRKKQVLI